MSYGYSQNAGLTMLSVASVGGLIGSYVFGLLAEKISTKKASLVLRVWYIIALLIPCN